VVEFLPNLLPRVLFRLPSLACNSILKLICDPRARCSSTEHYESRLIPLNTIDLESRHNGCEGHAASALYIVIETSNFRCVLVKDSTGVVKAKVLKVDVGFGITLSACLDKGRDEFVVFLTMSTGLAETKIEVIVEVFLVLLFIRHDPAPRMRRESGSHLCRSPGLPVMSSKGEYPHITCR
jgi:hypothetical protein